jgi:hypothetical protein
MVVAVVLQAFRLGVVQDDYVSVLKAGSVHTSGTRATGAMVNKDNTPVAVIVYSVKARVYVTCLVGGAAKLPGKVGIVWVALVGH